MEVVLLFSVPFLVHDVEPAVRDVIRSKVLAYLDSESGKQDVVPADELREMVIGAGSAFRAAAGPVDHVRILGATLRAMQ